LAVVVEIEAGGSSLLGRVVTTGGRAVVVFRGSCVVFVVCGALACFAPEHPTRKIAAAGIAAAIRVEAIDLGI